MAWIHEAVSEKPEFTDDGRTDGRTTDACAMTVGLLAKSKRAKKQTQQKYSKKIHNYGPIGGSLNLVVTVSDLSCGK